MIALLALLLAAPELGASDASRYQACLAIAESEPDRAVAMAQGWRIEGGGIPARHCLGRAQAGRGDSANAIVTLETAAREAREAGSGLAMLLWQQAGETALGAGKPAQALPDIDAALAMAGDGKTAAPLHLLRAEALVDLKREADAMAAIDTALAGDADVAWGWLLKATLARRLGDYPAAEAAILEAGNIAAAQGKTELAQAAWAAAAADTESVAGKAAAKALAAKE